MQYLKALITNEKSPGILLIICTLFSLLIANSTFGPQYSNFWHTYIGSMTIEHWINDGLVTLFFLLIGLELEREMYTGGLSKPKNSIFPIAAAIGGMLVPIAIFMWFNINNKETVSGVGIPMATDIAFAVGILSLLGKRIPASLRLFLMALAVVDDLGAILFIALFYTKTLYPLYLIAALSIAAVLAVLNKRKVNNLYVYTICGAFMWFFMLKSGVHATIAGVILAFIIPFRRGNWHSPSYKIQHALHYPVMLIILPLFALANTGIVINKSFAELLNSDLSLGIFWGLIVGKPLGIFIFSYLSVKLKICKIPEGINIKGLWGISFLGGIGFTMSIFITLLAFDNPEMINNAKLAVLSASLLAALAGYFILLSMKNKTAE